MMECTIANYNCPGQIVITGKTEAVEQAARSSEGSGRKKNGDAQRQRPFPFTDAGPGRGRTDEGA